MKKLVTLFSLFAVFIISCKDEKKTNQQSNKTQEYSVYIKQLMEATEKHPDSVGLRFVLVSALDSAGFYKDALIQMDKLITKDSLNNGFWFKKGSIQQNAKDTLGAMLSFKRAINVYASVDALLSLANLYAETKNDSALLYTAAVERINPDRKFEADCIFINGVYFARAGKIKEALDLFDACINASHTYMVAYMEKGFIYYETKNYDEALKTFQLATKVTNTYTDAYYWQGKCYEAKNDKQNAILFYQKSLSLDKNIVEAEQAIERLSK